MNSPRSNAGRASRLSAYLLAALVVGLALSCNSRALAVAASANGLQIEYNLTAGTDSAPINPAGDTPVLVIGACTTAGFRGVGHVNLQRQPGLLLAWTGINSTPAGTMTHGSTSLPGFDIVQIGSGGQVVLEVNTADNFRVHNGSTGSRRGWVSLFW